MHLCAFWADVQPVFWVDCSGLGSTVSVIMDYFRALEVMTVRLIAIARRP